MGFCDDLNEQPGSEDKTKRSPILLESSQRLVDFDPHGELVSSLVRPLFLEFGVERFRIWLCTDYSILTIP